jgi:hypothetical protein
VATEGQVPAAIGLFVMMPMRIMRQEPRRQTFRAENDRPACIDAAGHVARRGEALQEQRQRDQ